MHDGIDTLLDFVVENMGNPSTCPFTSIVVAVFKMVELFAKNQNRHKLRALELFTMAMCQNKDKPKAFKLSMMEEVECLTMFFCSSPWQTQPNPTSIFPSPSFMHCCMKIT
jgi:hypothetical protein